MTESWMNGAAIVLSDGREIPITDTMVRKSLEELAEESETKAGSYERAASSN
ncbi:PA1571 family protein [Marinobacter fonticola]|uniref:PA1571 family protein n=1 Tax=Marinobacter fonticola TaxID=2603215 RepID=UPI00143DA68B|nr:PA1571 family protein [Marinobacter fonticola]